MTVTEPHRSSTSTASTPPGRVPAVPAAVSTPSTTAVHPGVTAWVNRIAALTEPDAVVWCTGSAAEREDLLRIMMEQGTVVQLDPEHRPNSYLARSDPSDVARVESRTFICSAAAGDAGPMNNWKDPVEMRAILGEIFAGAMRGRTMYVVPFSMGPLGSPLAKLGVQVTDSPYVVASTGIMTRMGTQALDQFTPETDWVPAVHSVGAPLSPGAEDVSWPCNPTKYISHFPETREIWSYGSAYGGNAVLAKKSFALRIASVVARDEGWMAEHMLILKVTNPRGRAFHVVAAFPSACGKTNLAMLRSTIPGWKVETIGDDIAWLRQDEVGRLRAINPEAGFFGVAPGTGPTTNQTAIDTLWGNTIFTNVALRDNGDVWWEGLSSTPPDHLVDWQGNDWTPESGTLAAHPNSRFTVAAEQCPAISDDWNDPEGVVIDAIIFGGRRATNVPLVLEARNWEHGVYLGATISSEQTAAAEGTVGELRRDPFAMRPVCGYNMADYWGNWLAVGETLVASGTAPKIFQVNWFRKDENGKFLWPGFGENSRVLEWILDRVDGSVGAEESALGLVPTAGALNVTGLNLPEGTLEKLFEVNPEMWLAELDSTADFFDTFGGRVPEPIRAQLSLLRSRLAPA